MKRAKALVALALWLGVAAALPAEPLRVVATTSLLASVIQEVGGGRVQVTVLIPPASCPGHFDLRPGDVAAIRRSGVLFAHQFERFVDRVGEAAGKGVRVYRVAVEGNWLVPDTYVRAAEQVAAVLIRIDPAGKAVYQRRLSQLRQRARALDSELRQHLASAGVARTPVVGAQMLEPLLRWMGLNLVATYGRAEDLAPAQWQQVAHTARSAGARLVVDNLQSGADTGTQLARELGVQHVVLSNFPGGFANTSSWESCLRENVRRIIEGVKAQRQAKQ
ncbi:MAG: metal ABC transporter substrate-binding protein [Armatimonadota bacterium]|nr:metal ABC transporter substrate-binding protein [Armatimonadota bacterium]